MKKKIEQKIRILLENISKTKHRAIFIIIGDRGKDQVNTLS